MEGVSHAQARQFHHRRGSVGHCRTVTIGVDQSEVRAGKVTRTKLDCGKIMFVPTGNSDAQFAGRVFRGTKPHTP
jgi:hypothetical protein